MKNSKSQWYSKSPWVVIGDKVGPIRSYGYEGCDKEHKEVAIVPQVLGSFDGDLHLISAAPEMYEALEWLLHLHHGVSKGGENTPITDKEWEHALSDAMKAVKKARGEG